jgi:hypothetical protein
VFGLVRVYGRSFVVCWETCFGELMSRVTNHNPVTEVPVTEVSYF